MCISKKFLITPDWKCVDFRQPVGITFDEQKRISEKCRQTDFFDVCPMCRYFKPKERVTKEEIDSIRSKGHKNVR
jgi:hypothetical protein